MNSAPSHFSVLRDSFHLKLLEKTLCIANATAKQGAAVKWSNADGSNAFSIEISEGIAGALLKRLSLSFPPSVDAVSGQGKGDAFERITKEFVEGAFLKLQHIRPGAWEFETGGGQISRFWQYAHLKTLQDLGEKEKSLKTSLGNGYLIEPDFVVFRKRLSAKEVNRLEPLVDVSLAQHSDLVKNDVVDSLEDDRSFLLHASISCKWTIRSDRVQNARTEALNLIRNRKGRTPHIMVVTAEPLPSRLVSVALGTGDIDCVYHFALYELQEAVKNSGNSEAKNLLEMMIDGRRLKDISDLPLDLAV